MEEAKLLGVSARELDPQWDERRRGDSDVDWGSEDDGEGEGEGGGGGQDDGGLGLAEGMELDPDLKMDDNIKAMEGFVKSLSQEGSRFVTMQDIEDGEVMRLEDEEGVGLGGLEDSEEEEDDDDESTDSEDDDDVDAI
ncbi:hypothetical protein H0H93_004824, partial [Arthromyces matolae]